MKSQHTQGQVIPFIQNSEYFFKRGVHAYQKQELKRAVKYVRRAVELNPQQGVFQCQLAAIYSDMGEYHTSNDLLLHVLDDVDADLYECYFFLANNYAYLGFFDKAGETARQYLSLVPEGDFSEDARDLLDMLQMEEEQEDVIPPDTDDELIITYERALRMIKENRYYEAETYLENIVAEYPLYFAAQSQLARVLFLKGQIEEALAYAKDVWLEHHYLPAGCQLALFYSEAGRDKEAVEAAGMLKRLIPMDRDNLFRLASTLCLLHECEKAHRLFRMYLLRFTPEDANFFFHYGVAAYESGRLGAARKQWELAKAQGHRGAETLLEKLGNDLLYSSDVHLEAWTYYQL
ncbi:tetratricopeptide repeat protein [Salibacterium aidingense]|uniref:tetratricopeptide repeat protein n=1 Tax=Salibacterium aidingense TaxID=384933 RepID=UPI003BC4DFB4